MFELSNVEKVIFFNDKQSACIFYNDYTLKYTSIDDGKIAASYLKNKEGLNNDDLSNYNGIEFCSFDDFESKYKDEIYLRGNKTRYVLSEIKEEEDRRRKKRKRKESKSPATRYKVVSILVSLGLLATATTIGGGGYYLYKKLFNGGNITNEADKDLENTNANIKAENEIASIINNNDLNVTKRNFVAYVYEYLLNYNSNFASKHIDSNTSTKAAITFDEIVAQLIVYKNYDRGELFEIFGYDKFISEDMYNAYISCIEQETKAHIIQTESLDKKFLKGKKKEIYDKYEGLMINYNIQNSEERKIEVAKEFWNEVRNDINIEEADKLPRNMEIILPIVNAMKKICKNLDIDEKLNSEEYDWYVTECDQRIREKLSECDKKLGDVATVKNRLGAVVVISFSQIKDTIIKQLTDKGIYNIEDYERDISDHEEYQTAIKYFKKPKDDNSDNEIKEDSDSNSDDYDVDENQVDKDDTDSEDMNKNKTSKSEKKNKSKSNNGSNPTSTDDNEPKKDNNDDSYTDSNDNSSDEINNDTNDNSNASDINKGESEEKNNNGYPDYIKDVTDDESGAYESFPDLNEVNNNNNMTKSQYADQIIRMMENIPTDEEQKVACKKSDFRHK